MSRIRYGAVLSLVLSLSVLASACTGGSEPSNPATSTTSTTSSVAQPTTPTTTAASLPRGADDPSLPESIASDLIKVDESTILAPGSSITFEGELEPGEKAVYRVLEAKRGETISATLDFLEGEGSFSVYGPGTELLTIDASPFYTVALPEGGAYLVIVGTSDPSFEFELTLGIE